MAIDGSYNILVSTPMGKQEARITLKTDGNSLSGIVAMKAGEQSFDNGTLSGNECALTVQVNTPMGRMDVEFKGTIDGDTISGQAKLPFGWADFTGTRVMTDSEQK
jgi:hypothetical protein